MRLWHLQLMKQYGIRRTAGLKQPKLTSIDSIATELGIALNMKAILNLSLGGENCGVWFFADHRVDRPFDQQDFYFAYCDETYRNNVVLFVYRGHSLYGI